MPISGLKENSNVTPLTDKVEALAKFQPYPLMGMPLNGTNIYEFDKEGNRNDVGIAIVNKAKEKLASNPESYPQDSFGYHPVDIEIKDANGTVVSAGWIRIKGDKPTVDTSGLTIS